MKIRVLLILVFLLIAAAYTIAQDEPEPEVVEIAAADGLTLVGDYYDAATDTPAPAILLMHMNNGKRDDWLPLIPSLLEIGYNVLAVDLRGFGDSKGDRDWEAATSDVQTWLDWLREQPNVRPEAVSTGGASIGSNLAIVGCANDEQCVTAIALSPGENYFGVEPQEFLTNGLRGRSALLVAAQGDRESSVGVKAMIANTNGEIGVQLYTGSLHGTSLFISPDFKDRLIALIVDWLVEHTPAVEG